MPKTPPGPRGHFLIGNLWQLFQEPFAFTLRCARDYGDVVRLRLGTLVIYMINHPDAIEEVLRSKHRLFQKDRGTHLLSSVLGQGLVTSEADLWRRQRRLTQPAFQLDQIQKYSTVMAACAGRALEGWRPGQNRDVHADMMRLTLEIVARSLFGADVTDHADRVGRAMDTVTEFFASPLALFPWLHWLPLSLFRRYRRAVRELDAVLYATIGRRRTATESGDGLLTRLLAARDEDGSPMTDRQLRDELVTLFLAGHETTALVLTFCFYLLAQHPETDARLAAELDDVLGGRPPAAADVSRLSYTEWVVKEAMRLYPPVPSIGREALVDCEIGGYSLRKGAQLTMIQWVVHRDPRWFDDPEVFRPERWDNDLARHLPRCAYFPFGDGPRVCIGNQFAMMEAVLLLATVAQRYRLELRPGYRLELVPSVTLRPKSGVPMVIHDRRDEKRAKETAAQAALAVP